MHDVSSDHPDPPLASDRVPDLECATPTLGGGTLAEAHTQ